MRVMVLCVVALAMLAGCSDTQDAVGTETTSGGEVVADCAPEALVPDGEALHLSDPAGRVVARVVHRPVDVPGAPELGTYQIHLVDVGTGLAVLVRGADFTFLFDGGSSDDSSAGANNRLLAYLASAIGLSPLAGCAPTGDSLGEAAASVPRIDAIMLSHPHQDHGALLPDVLRCYEVADVYDVGVVNQRAFYRRFLQAVADEPGVTYLTVVDPPSPPRVEVFGANVDLGDVDWQSFAEGDELELGQGALLTVLAADGDTHSSGFNDNSLVVRIDLGEHSLLLTGDAEAGVRISPDRDPPPTARQQEPEDEHTEGRLMRHHRAQIDVDILQVGHHGSMTSSRPDFIEAVSPSWALIGAGPRRYSEHRLPDATVERMLEETVRDVGGYVLNTDFDDRRCPVGDRVGRNDPVHEGSGGCSNYVLFLRP